ncbi:MAG: hypothetical protein ACREXR_00215 [Gammaproteobacteria bacterium]
MRGFIYFIVLLHSLLFAQSASAATTYFWTYTGDNPRFSSPSEACEAARLTRVAAANGNQFYLPVVISKYQKNNESAWDCWVTSGDPGYGNLNTYIIQRFGDSCQQDHTYNSNTGACDPPPTCADKAGVKLPFTKSGTAPDPYMFVSAGWQSPVQAACFSGCAVSTVDQKCTGRAQSGLYTCRGTAVYTGQTCSTSGTGPAISENTSSAPPPEPETIVEKKPCVYATQADGTQSCTSTDSEDNEGQYCGTVNGVKTCIDKKPSKDGVDVTTTVKTETAADGTKTVTKTDVATKTTCTGMLQCTSTTTTTKTVTKTDGSGNTASVTGTCTGAACPNTNGNPDGDGDGFGDCTGDSCSDGEAVGAQDWYQPGEDTYASVMTEFAQGVGQLPVLQGVSNFLNFAPSGACPRYSVDAWVFNIRLDQWCTGDIPWDLIKAVVMGACAFLAFRIAFL